MVGVASKTSLWRYEGVLVTFLGRYRVIPPFSFLHRSMIPVFHASFRLLHEQTNA